MAQNSLIPATCNWLQNVAKTHLHSDIDFLTLYYYFCMGIAHIIMLKVVN